MSASLLVNCRNTFGTSVLSSHDTSIQRRSLFSYLQAFHGAICKQKQHGWPQKAGFFVSWWLCCCQLCSLFACTQKMNRGWKTPHDDNNDNIDIVLTLIHTLNRFYCVFVWFIRFKGWQLLLSEVEMDGCSQGSQTFPFGLIKSWFLSCLDCSVRSYIALM